MNTRYMGSFGFAVCVTFGLFFVMQYLVTLGPGGDIEPIKTRPIELGRVIKDNPAQPKQRVLPPKPDAVEPPPMPPIPINETNNPGGGIGLNPPEGIEEVLGPIGAIGAPANGDVLPIVRNAPRYPPRFPRTDYSPNRHYM
ncbi:MAG: hypothetical protein ACE5EM_09740 [Sphingomonadales bacterium]